jgi:sucrose-6F-phosphate phosphohydrolase
MERLAALISDVDGTLVGDDDALNAFRDWRRDAGREVRLAYSSGRFVRSVLKSVAVQNLPMPDAIIGGVGTQILDVADGTFLANWPATSDHWDAELIQSVCLAHAELRLQPREFVSPHKISFYGDNLDAHFLASLEANLAAAGQRVSIVYSSQRDLDVLPAGVDKGTAAIRLCRHWKLSRTEVIVAGDSGNDLAMMRYGFSAVAVANSQPELKAHVAPEVFHARTPFAAGVLEGVNHWVDAAAVTGDQSTSDPHAGRGMHG